MPRSSSGVTITGAASGVARTRTYGAFTGAEEASSVLRHTSVACAFPPGATVKRRGGASAPVLVAIAAPPFSTWTPSSGVCASSSSWACG